MIDEAHEHLLFAGKNMEPHGLAFDFEGATDGPFGGVDFGHRVGRACGDVERLLIASEREAHRHATDLD